MDKSFLIRRVSLIRPASLYIKTEEDKIDNVRTKKDNLLQVKKKTKKQTPSFYFTYWLVVFWQRFAPSSWCNLFFFISRTRFFYNLFLSFQICHFFLCFGGLTICHSPFKINLLLTHLSALILSTGSDSITARGNCIMGSFNWICLRI